MKNLVLFFLLGLFSCDETFDDSVNIPQGINFTVNHPIRCTSLIVDGVAGPFLLRQRSEREGDIAAPVGSVITLTSNTENVSEENTLWTIVIRNQTTLAGDSRVTRTDGEVDGITDYAFLDENGNELEGFQFRGKTARIRVITPFDTDDLAGISDTYRLDVVFNDGAIESRINEITITRRIGDPTLGQCSGQKEITIDTRN